MPGRRNRAFRVKLTMRQMMEHYLPHVVTGGVDTTWVDALVKANEMGLQGKKITRIIPHDNPAMLEYDFDVVFGDAKKEEMADGHPKKEGQRFLGWDVAH